jgi:hypothetical protein
VALQHRFENDYTAPVPADVQLDVVQSADGVFVRLAFNNCHGIHMEFIALDLAEQLAANIGMLAREARAQLGGIVIARPEDVKGVAERLNGFGPGEQGFGA